MSATTTALAPAAAASTALALPIPPPAPVIRAIFPSSIPLSFMTDLLVGWWCTGTNSCGVTGATAKWIQDRRSRGRGARHRSEEHTSELQSLMRISYAVFCLKKKNKSVDTTQRLHTNSHTKATNIQQERNNKLQAK